MGPVQVLNTYRSLCILWFLFRESVARDQPSSSGRRRCGWGTCLWLLNLNVINISLLALYSTLYVKMDVRDTTGQGKASNAKEEEEGCCWSVVVARLAIP